MSNANYWLRTMRGGVSRRRLLAATGAGALGAAFLAACGGDDESGSGAQRVVMALGAPPLETPKVTDISVPFTWVVGPAYEYLLGVSLDGEVNVPQLAESWNVEPDGKSVRFKLRRGVQFHNGKGEFTAKDVVYSWELMTGPDSKESRAERFRTSVSRIEVVNDYEVVFHLTKPDNAFLYSVGETDYGLKIVSKTDGESRSRWSFDDPFVAGTGPYVLKEWKQGQYVRFERAPGQHYRKTPDFKEFEYRFLPESSTRLAALLAKEVDIAVLPRDLQKQAEGQGFKRIRAKAEAGTSVILAFLGVYLNKKIFGNDPEPIPGGQQYRYNTPLLDDRVRKAMNKAINREELNKAYWGGEAQPIYNYGFAPSRPGWNPDWVKRFPEEYGYDPAEARKLLAAAGYDSSRPLTHTIVEGGGYGNFPELADLLESIAQNLRAVGINVKTETVETGIFRAKRDAFEYDNHSYLASLSVNQFVALNAAGGVASSYLAARGRFNEFAEPVAFVHERGDGLRWTLDPKQAEPMWRQLGDMQFNLHPSPPLFWLPVYATVNPGTVKDYQFSGALSGIYTNAEYIKSA